MPCPLHPFARCLPGPGSFSSKSDSLDSDAPSDPGAHLLTLLHSPTASSSPSCAGLFPLLHSPDLCCVLSPAGASSCPGPLLGAGSPHPLSPSSLPSLWAQCVPGSSQQASSPLLGAVSRGSSLSGLSDRGGPLLHHPLSVVRGSSPDLPHPGPGF